MKIVIELTKETYNEVRWRGLALCPRDEENLVKAIKNGIPLPKGHGDLIDRGKLERDTEWDDYEDKFISYSHIQIFNEPIVIPADKGELDDEDSN